MRRFVEIVKTASKLALMVFAFMALLAIVLLGLLSELGFRWGFM